ncbi:MAG: lipopolysaccharide biosynthesis protein [Caulobacteraceae bacterium]|nr:lipopolysaccharide biosynthesis protein [Caulobacteraceae bacterium]
MTRMAWTSEADAAAPFRRPAEATPVLRVRYTAGDLASLLWAERKLMLAVFLVLAALGMAAAFTFKTVYPAQSSVLVRLGREYVYQPPAGDAARGAVPEADAVVQSEVEILSSAQLKERVIDQVGIARLYPGIGADYDSASPVRRQAMMGKAVAAMTRALKIVSAPGMPVVRLTFEHPDAQLAALTLNTLLDEYLIYRRSVLLSQAAPLDDQRRAFEARLNEADQAYESFLGDNDIGDFEAEKTSLAQLQASLQQQKFTTDDQLRDRQARLAALSAQAGQLTPEINLYHDIDHAAQDKLTDLEIQRQGLLSRYQPTAAPVVDLDNQIAALQRAIQGGGVGNGGALRVGANPVFQTVQADRIQLIAEVAALHQSSEALADQIDQVTQRQLRLAQLEPRYQGLTRDRDVLRNNVRDFTVKEQETEAADAIARAGDDNISVIERPVPPTQGKSLRRPVMALALMLALFTAICTGLLRIFLRPGLPTPASAARTLELPVLATLGVKAS